MYFEKFSNNNLMNCPGLNNIVVCTLDCMGLPSYRY